MGVLNLSKNLIKAARSLRKEYTDTERFLWKHLRRRQLNGLKFRRQQPIGKYIVDFVCFEKQIVVEVDGGQHQEKRDKDIERDRWLQNQGFKVLRFWDNEVLKNIKGVLEVIRESSFVPPSPLSPPIQGGETKTSFHQGRRVPTKNGEEPTFLIIL